MKRKAIVTAGLLVLALPLAFGLPTAQVAPRDAPPPGATGTLRGSVTSGGREHVGFASVMVLGTRVGTMADSAGRFELRSVPIGERRILFRAIRHEKLDTLVTVVAGENPPLHVDLVDVTPLVTCQPCFWVDPYQQTRNPAPDGMVLDYVGERWQALTRGDASGLEISSDADPCTLRVIYAFIASVPRARLSVVDSAGRTVRTFKTATSAGRHDIVWDGVDGAGERTPYGWYRMRLETPRETLELEFVRASRLPLR